MNALERLQEALGLWEIPLEELARPFYHSSYVNESPDPIESNERLEFLGDAVIELAVAEYLFATYPRLSEGQLTRIKSAVVSGKVLAEKARELGLDGCLYLGRGEEPSGRSNENLLGDAFEALMGLVFERLGYRRASQLVLELLQDEIVRVATGEHRRDYKTLLQEWAQARNQKPVYILVGAEGPDHCKEFTVRVEVNGLSALGRGSSKKAAEQDAARHLYEQLVV
ncbi:MAG: ribonuclease III [Candidatus Bipolaricaulota bacterium]|nr:ribonuclease III [Candidatus Bipolaricaulota bacterium]MCS7274204.1 ribonuclease III [Candidatus Bipolaricaulota bacterium]MDW8110630.1 ribonuclease III [Candidatus Bipolaricaulota bacterium]MDW8328512.1 ribonuclease III [Candidatus Bipolaricaulota bacterium]